MSTLIATNPATSYVPQIINLPITPYSDDVATYVNNLEPEEIYRMFNERNTADVLTAALYAIYQLESNAHNTLIKGEKIEKPNIPASFAVLVSELKGMGFQVELKNIKFFKDKNKEEEEETNL